MSRKNHAKRRQRHGDKSEPIPGFKIEDQLVCLKVEDMKKFAGKNLSMLDGFFREVHETSRKETKESPQYMENIWAIVHNSNVLLLNRTIDEFIDAYEKTLDHYKDGGWAGYWSLIDFDENTGEVKGYHLGDTVDREIFWKNFGMDYFRTGDEERDEEIISYLNDRIDDNIVLAKKNKDEGHVMYLENYKREISEKDGK